MADSKEWVSFDSEEDSSPKEIPVLEKPRDKPDFMTSEAYISVLEKKLSKIKGKNQSKVSSKDLLESLQQAKECHLERLTTGEGGCVSHIEAFVLEDHDKPLRDSKWCCMNAYVQLFPKQPINRQELECLVTEDKDDDDENDKTLSTPIN